MDIKYELGDYEREYNRYVARLWARQISGCEPPQELLREAERTLEGARQAANIIYETDNGVEAERVAELLTLLFSAEHHGRFRLGYPSQAEAEGVASPAP